MRKFECSQCGYKFTRQVGTPITMCIIGHQCTLSVTSVKQYSRLQSDCIEYCSNLVLHYWKHFNGHCYASRTSQDLDADIFANCFMVLRSDIKNVKKAKSPELFTVYTTVVKQTSYNNNNTNKGVLCFFLITQQSDIEIIIIFICRALLKIHVTKCFTEIAK